MKFGGREPGKRSPGCGCRANPEKPEKGPEGKRKGKGEGKRGKRGRGDHFSAGNLEMIRVPFCALLRFCAHRRGPAFSCRRLRRLHLELAKRRPVVAVGHAAEAIGCTRDHFCRNAWAASY